MNDPDADAALRYKAAVSALPYLHAKLTPVGYLRGEFREVERKEAEAIVRRLGNGKAA